MGYGWCIIIVCVMALTLYTLDVPDVPCKNGKGVVFIVDSQFDIGSPVFFSFMRENTF